MPTYEHECQTCGARRDVIYSPFDSDFDTKVVGCLKCGKPAIRIISKTIQLVFRGETWNDKQVKLDKEMQNTQQALSEPLTDTELNELPDIAREEEQRRGLTEGSILGKQGTEHKPDPVRLKKRALDQAELVK